VRTLIDAADRAHLAVSTAIGTGLLAALLVIIIRIGFVVPLVASMRRQSRQAEGFRDAVSDLAGKAQSGEELPKRFSRTNTERLLRRLTRAKNDAQFLIDERFGWRAGGVIAWSGMRGAVTVAAAQTLPLSTPFRAQVLLIAFVVAVTTLLLQGGTLPWVIAVMHVTADDRAADVAAYQDLLADLDRCASTVLDDPDLAMVAGGRFEPVVVDRVREETAYLRRLPADDLPEGVNPREQYRDLSMRVLQAQQDELLRVRSSGAHNSRVLTHAQTELDRQLSRLQQDTSD
jgi:monovalent cation/hydrogen antiporter